MGSKWKIASLVGGAVAVAGLALTALTWAGIGPEDIWPKQPTGAGPLQPAPPSPAPAHGPPGAPPSGPASPVAPSGVEAPPRLAVEILGAEVVEYTGLQYRARVRIKLNNTTANPLKAVWLDPADLVRFAATDGATFVGPLRSREDMHPTGLNPCHYKSGPMCWDRAPAVFTTVAPGDTVHSVVTLVYRISRAKRTSLPKELPGVFSSKVYLVDQVTGYQDTQDLSQEITLQNPNGI